MSYILDALRKAERDRNLGRMPSLDDVTHAPPGTAASARSLRLVGLFGLVGALLLLAVILRPAASTPDSAPEGVAAPVQVLPAAAPVPALAAVAPPAPAEPVPLANPEPAIAALDADAPVESLDELMDAEPEPAIEPEPEARAEPVAEAAQTAPVVAPPASAAAPPEPTGFKLLRDMPSDYRAAFSNLRVDVHVYDADPARRWALINGSKQLEGSTLAEGPRIVEITPEGIAFDYRGQTALFPLNR